MDIVLEALKQWKGKQSKRQETNPNVTAILTEPTSFVFLMIMDVIGLIMAQE